MSKVRLPNPRLITGLTGLECVPDPHKTLSKLYTATMEDIKALPESYPYRIETERLTKERWVVIVAHRLQNRFSFTKIKTFSHHLNCFSDIFRMLHLLISSHPQSCFTRQCKDSAGV